MSGPRIGSLCTGYGGLDGATQSVLGGELAWVADNDPGAAKILAHRMPGVPNLGDITAVDWAGVEPVDVLTAGFPCQDISCAGKRAGLREGTRSGLWRHVARAIAELRPPLVVIENVKELLSEYADSDMEPCAWCLGDAGDKRAMRALGAVLADLAALGFDAEWTSLPASGVGCCHLRWRVFLAAWPAADPRASARENRQTRRSPSQLAGTHGKCLAAEVMELLPTPNASDGKGRQPAAGGGGADLPQVVTLLPTPNATDAGGVRALPAKRTHAGPDHGPRLRDVVPALLPTPAVALADGGQSSRSGNRSGELLLAGVAQSVAHLACDGLVIDWRQYGPAIRRHEAVIGRPPPCPVEPGRTGLRLAPRFAEWMMMLPAGWVTDVPGLSRNAQLKALGNGVVPQQAELALRLLLAEAFGWREAA